MANVAHSSLTGADLHEPKGAAAATANKVYVSDGAGSGAWTATSTLNPFSNQLFHVQDSVSSGTAAQSLTSATWNTRRFQTTLTNEISSASLSSNQVSLPAGTYFLQCQCIFNSLVTSTNSNTYHAKLRLRNITDGSTTLSGTSHTLLKFIDGASSVSISGSFDLFVGGRFTIAGTKTLEIQAYVTNGTIIRAGTPASLSENEIYANLMIWKV